MIRRAVVTKVSNDKGPVKLVTVESEGKEMDVEVFETDGASSNPLEGSSCLLLPVQGDDGQIVAIIGAPPAVRVDQQKPGEKTYKNHDSGNYIKHDADGNTVIKTTADTIIGSGGIVHINPV
jgi:phage gp45-like